MLVNASSVVAAVNGNTPRQWLYAAGPDCRHLGLSVSAISRWQLAPSRLKRRVEVRASDFGMRRLELVRQSCRQFESIYLPIRSTCFVWKVKRRLSIPEILQQPLESAGLDHTAGWKPGNTSAFGKGLHELLSRARPGSISCPGSWWCKRQDQRPLRQLQK
jgi:hypothetical protein